MQKNSFPFAGRPTGEAVFLLKAVGKGSGVSYSSVSNRMPKVLGPQWQEMVQLAWVM